MEKTKNCWLIPTDKPSRLYEFGELWFLNMKPTECFRNYNIYITSDEEIKEGDWFIQVNTSKRIKHHSKNGLLLQPQSFDKKIILTTDQELIKDGVQAIYDEFLEWFVKNPSCDRVEVENIYYSDTDRYEIIIPKEEPKQETLEEAAKKDCLINNIPTDQMIVKHDRSCEFETPVTMFIKGAKWQTEQNNTSKINRVEVIQHSLPYNGRAYTNYNAKNVEIQFQDDNTTLKIFLK